MKNDPVVYEYDPVDEELDGIAKVFLDDLCKCGYVDKEGKMIGAGLQGEDFT